MEATSEGRATWVSRNKQRAIIASAGCRGRAVRRCRCGSCGREFAGLDELVASCAVEMRCPHCMSQAFEAIERVEVRRCPECRVVSATGREGMRGTHVEAELGQRSEQAKHGE